MCVLKIFKCHLSFTLVLIGLAWLALSAPVQKLAAAENSALVTATNSINSNELRRHVETLADDALEGREAGSRGGRAAAVYVRNQLQSFGIQPAGPDGDYFQLFQGRFRNILGKIEGRDPVVKDEFIIVGAHYDHVGYGNRTNSFGPFGYIHNGADDNASGTAGLLEVVEAFTKLEQPPRRSILFAFWDGEEKGLLGSKHYVSDPVIPLRQTKMMLNADMIGRLRGDQLMIYGSRTAAGCRRLASSMNVSDLVIDFTWEMKDNSDHYSFFEHGLPVMMLHTGLHDDYHRPRDDADKINTDGVQRVSRMLFSIAYELAEADEVPRFRDSSRRETLAMQKQLQSNRRVERLPSRLGVGWQPDEQATDGLRITRVTPGSAAERSELQVNDRILRFDGRPIMSGSELRAAVVSARSPVRVVLLRGDRAEPIELMVELDGKPHRLGIGWITDDAEPDALIVSRVIPDSPADRAGIQLNDRVYEIDGHRFYSAEQFIEEAQSSPGPISLLIERDGRLREFLVTGLTAPEADTN
jgi:hypothetical protein